jgi:hypothetical protein
MAATESREHNHRHGNAVRDRTDGGRGLGVCVLRGYYEDKFFAKCFDGSEGKLRTFWNERFRMVFEKEHARHSVKRRQHANRGVCPTSTTTHANTSTPYPNPAPLLRPLLLLMMLLLLQ